MSADGPLFEREPVGFRPWVGVAFAIAGLCLLPVGHLMAGHGVTVVSFVLLFVGIGLLFNARVQARAERVEREATNAPAVAPGLITGDIHNHTGWLTGWRKQGGVLNTRDADDRAADEPGD